MTLSLDNACGKKMKIKGLIEEDYSNFKEPSMFVIMPYCTFKCEKECGERCCQNSALAQQPIVEVDCKELIERYMANKITKAVVFGGLEPIDSFDELFSWVKMLRHDYHCEDPVIIYTGYDAYEIGHQINQLRPLGNIIMKFGRFRPNGKQHFDNILGVVLASDNQYAIRI